MNPTKIVKGNILCFTLLVSYSYAHCWPFFLIKKTLLRAIFKELALRPILSQSSDVCLCDVPFSCYLFRGLSLALRSHDQIPAFTTLSVTMASVLANRFSVSRKQDFYIIYVLNLNLPLLLYSIPPVLSSHLDGCDPDSPVLLVLLSSCPIIQLADSRPRQRHVSNTRTRGYKKMDKQHKKETVYT